MNCQDIPTNIKTRLALYGQPNRPIANSRSPIWALRLGPAVWSESFVKSVKKDMLIGHSEKSRCHHYPGHRDGHP